MKIKIMLMLGAIIAILLFVPVWGQLVDINVDTQVRAQSVGVVPFRIAPDIYRAPVGFKPLSLAVYRDGLRCKSGCDYRIRNRDVIFTAGTTWPETTVLLDYEPR